MFVKNNRISESVLPSGVKRKIKGYIDDLMVCELTWQKGMRGELHSHEHRQCGYILSGSFEATVGEKTEILHAGDCFYTEKNEPHSLVCLEDNSVMLDIFTPLRKDFLH